VPTAIAVTSPDLVLPPTDRQTPTAAVFPPPAEQPLDAALADLQLLVDRHGYVVVVYPAALDAAHERRLSGMRAILESDRVALVRADLPPLGVAVLARQLRQLSSLEFSPGVLASAARLLGHYVYAGALLGSVARLDRVKVPLASHARSWLPGTHYAVLAHPAPQLVRVGEGEPAGPEFLTDLVMARNQLAPDWVSGTLAPHWQVRSVQEVPLPGTSPGWWGTSRLVEFAAYLPDLTVLHQLVSSVRVDLCSWCGLELIGDRCGFCSAPLAPPPEIEHRARRALPRGPAMRP
jgi:hypothetical protein